MMRLRSCGDVLRPCRLTQASGKECNQNCPWKNSCTCAASWRKQANYFSRLRKNKSTRCKAQPIKNFTLCTNDTNDAILSGSLSHSDGANDGCRHDAHGDWDGALWKPLEWNHVGALGIADGNDDDGL